MSPNLIMKARTIINFFGYTFLCLTMAVSMCSCQHRIHKKDLEYPPEYDETGVNVSVRSPEEAEAELKKIAEAPYPPYTIQPGDMFRIRVYGEEDLTDSSGVGSHSIITPDGYLILPLLSPILVKGLTIVEATDKITQAYSEYVRYPKVSIIPTQIQGKKATVLGAVTNPGIFTVSDNTRISDIIATAGGFATGWLDGKTVDMADVPSSYIVREGEMLPVNFTEAVFKGNPLHNIKVLPDDMVYIVRRDSSRVMVFGEVNSPRQLNWTAGMTVVDVIAQASGLKDEHWGTALILRRSKGSDPGSELKVYKVDIDDLLSGRGRNFKVAAEDIVYIPKDAISEYNVFVKKLLPTAQLINAASSPIYWFNGSK